MYSSGLKLAAAAILTQNPFFEMASRHDCIVVTLVKQIKQRNNQERELKIKLLMLRIYIKEWGKFLLVTSVPDSSKNSRFALYDFGHEPL